MNTRRIILFLMLVASMLSVGAFCNQITSLGSPLSQTSPIIKTPSIKGAPLDLTGKSQPSLGGPASALSSLSSQELFVAQSGPPGDRGKGKDKGPVATPEIGGIGPTLLVVLVGVLFFVCAERRKIIQTVV
jgi:hypothetical protein